MGDLLEKAAGRLPAPLRKAIRRLPVVALALALTAALGLGVYAVADALSPWAAAAVGAVVLVAVWRRSWLGRAVVAFRVLVAILVAFLALAGADVLLNALDVHLPIWLGLVFALIVFGLVAYWYLNRQGWSWRRRWRIAAAAGLAVLVIVGTPVIVALIKSNDDQVDPAKQIATKLDLLIVSGGKNLPQPPRLPPNPGLHGFDIGFSVGYAAAGGVRWTMVDEDCGKKSSEECADVALEAIAAGRRRGVVPGQPVHREGADTALLLLVDGTAPVVLDPARLPSLPFRRGEVSRWKRVAAAAAPAGTPAFALLQARGRKRLEHWKPAANTVQAVSAQALESKTATDAAARLAVAAPTSQADFGLALKFRPVLLFDQAEPVPWPLSVDALFNEHRVRLCHDEGELKTTCGEALAGADGLKNGGTHLKLELRKSEELRPLAKEQLRAQGVPSLQRAAPPVADTVPAGTPPAGVTEKAPDAEVPIGAGSTIYVHPVSISHRRREILLLDYWWYLPENPVSLGGGALCGAGMVIEGITCNSHQSDWEGVTVVVDRTDDRPHLVAVHYAQHSKVVRYGWPLLRRRWSRDPAIKPLVARVADAAPRPLVFVASGTHASYPTPCKNCGQVSDAELGEEPHRGGLGWVGNDSGACGLSNCLQMLPTHEGGRQPALWNGYEGTWGKHHCLLSYYCDSGSPPTAPGEQKRYGNPAYYSGIVNRDWRYVGMAGEE